MATTTQKPGRTRTEGGNALIEVSMAMVLLAVSLTAAAGVLGSSLSTSSKSRQLNRGARFLEEVMSSVEAQSYDALLAMNGNTFFDGATAGQSMHRIELASAQASAGLIQVVLVLRNQTSGAELARVATMRSQR